MLVGQDCLLPALAVEDLSECREVEDLSECRKLRKTISQFLCNKYLTVIVYAIFLESKWFRGQEYHGNCTIHVFP